MVRPDVDGLSVVAPTSLKFDIASNLGPLRQNCIKVIDWTQRLLPGEESGRTGPTPVSWSVWKVAGKRPLIACRTVTPT
jgi:hypothetical protein